jgi:hypothetical protein
MGEQPPIHNDSTNLKSLLIKSCMQREEVWGSILSRRVAAFAQDMAGARRN